MISQQEAAAQGDSGDGAQEGMPACRACQAAADSVHALLARATDPSAPGTAFNWAGVCNIHAWQLARQHAPARAIAVARLEAALQRLGAGDSGGNGRFGQRKASAVRVDRDGCPICVAMTAAAETVLEEAAASPTGLCLPHLCTALASVRGRERIQALAGAALTQFHTLEEELSELIRKSDYRFRDEPRGQEATSWTRTAQLLAGAPAVRWPLRRAPDIEG